MTKSLHSPAGIVCDSLSFATNPLARVRGLIGRVLHPNEGLLIRPCKQVHTFGTGFGIDAVFCDSGLSVLRVVGLPRRRVSPYVRRADCCIELSAGRAGAFGLGPGTQLEIREKVA